MALFGEYDWDSWLRGLISAFIGGGTSSFSAGLVAAGIDPSKTFQLGGSASWKLIGSMFALNGIIMFMQTLNKKPFPDKIVEKTVETTDIGGKTPLVVTTVKETSKEPQPPAGG